ADARAQSPAQDEERRGAARDRDRSVDAAGFHELVPFHGSSATGPHVRGRRVAVLDSARLMIDFCFSYGSDMNPARGSAGGLRAIGIRGATLPGHRLVFDKHASDHLGAAHANLVPDPIATVEGVLYELADEREIEKMDVFERAPVNYRRERVVVVASNVRIVAWTYFANPDVRREGLRPKRDYLAHLLAGRAFLSGEYVRRLEAIACVDD